MEGSALAFATKTTQRQQADRVRNKTSIPTLECLNLECLNQWHITLGNVFDKGHIRVE